MIIFLNWKIIWQVKNLDMNILLPLILLILPFISYLFLKKNFKDREIFLHKTLEQLDFEKKQLEKELGKQTDLVKTLEGQLLKNRNSLLENQEKSEQIQAENQALRTLIEELRKQNETKEEDIIVEYFIKNPQSGE